MEGGGGGREREGGGGVVELPSVVNTFPYQFGLKSDIDLAVDELGW